MSHLLIIRDKNGNVLAQVPVEHGYTIEEVAKKPAKPTKPGEADKAVSTGDQGKGRERAN